jgi:DNA-binding FrmR family transcriptional regulator
MEFLLDMDVQTAQETVAKAAAESGWQVDEVSAAPTLYRLRTGSAESARGDGWLVVEARGERAEVLVWLADEGVEAVARERLEQALEGLETGTGGESSKALLRRLRRVEGQVRGLQRMIGTGRECEAVMTQFAAVSAALRQTAAQLVAEHLTACIREEMAAGGDTAHINRRLLDILF